MYSTQCTVLVQLNESKEFLLVVEVKKTSILKLSESEIQRSADFA